MAKTITDVLEFLFTNGEKELAQVVLDEIVTKAPAKPLALHRGDIFTTPTPPNVSITTNPRKPEIWCSTDGGGLKLEKKGQINA